MNKRNLLIGGVLATLAIGLAALPGTSAARQDPEERAIAKAEQALRDAEEALDVQADAIELTQEAVKEVPQSIEVVTSLDGGGSWLGVQLEEVNAEKVKELKLPAERGVILSEILPDGPAAKAGLHAKDVVTEINGQRVESAAQFRRMIRELPAGRTVQLAVWRDGRSQTLNVTLGKSEEQGLARVRSGFSRDFVLRVPPMPEVRAFEWSGEGMFSRRPRLGVDAEDLSGQLGSYFGVPEGEGILVREVNPGSPAEKAGVKAGDVIFKLDGERIRGVGELREKLAQKKDKKTVTLGLLRNKSELSLSVELETPEAPKTRRLMSRRVSI